MDNTTEKPFACKSQGCGMSFTNEDHLNVHEKKHEMILNLGLENKSANVFVDQTPTPTRLIKNCEEVGLFDDLKHVNPFDETFRRAVESKQIDHHNNSTNNDVTFNSTQTNECLIINEESLHTPQVFPNLGSAVTTELCHEQQQQQEFQLTKQDVILSENLINDHKNSIEDELELSTKRQNKQEVTKSVKKRKLINNLNQIDVNNQNVNEQYLSSCNTSLQNQITAKPIILPNTISIIQPQIITLELPEAAVLPSKPILLPKTAELTNILNPPQQGPPINNVKEKLKNILNNHNSTSTSSLFKKTELNKKKYYPRKKKSNLLKNSNDEICLNANDDDSLERRRAAAMRYRKKIKREQADLKEKNSQLIAENTKLKATIRQLKQILANHQNCDVTLSSSLSSSIANPGQISNILNDSSSSLLCPSQKLVKSIIQIPTVKFLMNVPKIVVQQQQHQ